MGDNLLKILVDVAVWNSSFQCLIDETQGRIYEANTINVHCSGLSNLDLEYVRKRAPVIVFPMRLERLAALSSLRAFALRC